MPRDVRLFLYEVKAACDDILAFVEGKSLADYLGDRQLRHAVERNLMIIGEALNQANRLNQSIHEHLPDLRGIVDLRNVLIHGYYTVKHDIVWANIEREVPPLRDAMDQLLERYSE